MNEVKLGKILESKVARDAIHVALFPATSDIELKPGQHVQLVRGQIDKVELAVDNGVGVVDPFLQVHTKPGEVFYVLLYPNTITSLRHEWTHPAFEDTQEAREWLDRKAREFGWTLDTLLMFATEYWAKGEFFVGDYESYDFQYHYPEIREYLKKIGIEVPFAGEGTYFRCAC